MTDDTTAQASPRPWKIIDSDTALEIFDAKGALIMGCDDEDPEFWPMVVRAVNAFEHTKALADALEWYEERSRSMADQHRSVDYLDAVETEIILDGGKRARAALTGYTLAMKETKGE